MSQVSLFPTLNNPKNTKPIDLSQFLKEVREGAYSSLVLKIRSEIDKVRRDELKRKLPAITPSGVFSERNQANLIKHSGFIQVDIDNLESIDVRSHLEKDQYTYFCALSASGNGLFLFVKCDCAKHKETFEWLREYYFNKYSILIDPAPSSIVSLRFYSYDPDAYLNESSKVAKYKVKAKKKHKEPSFLLTGSDFETYLAEVMGQGIDLTKDTYARYLRIGFGLASEFGEAGREYYHDIASQGSKYIKENADKQYDYCLKGSNDGTTIATVYQYMKEEGIELKNSVPTNTISFAKAQVKLGETKESLKKTLQDVHGLNEEQAELAIDKCESFRLDKVDPDDHGAFIKVLREYIESRWNPRYNEAKQVFEANGKEVDDYFYNEIALTSKEELSSPKVTDRLIEQAIYSTKCPKYNPLKEWLVEHKDIERGTELEKLFNGYVLDCDFEEEEERLLFEKTIRIFLLRWLISIIASIHGEIPRLVLGFIGVQKIGKTTWFRNLLPPKLSEYFAESRFQSGKDDEILMCKKLIVLNDEGFTGGEKEATRFKDLVSKDKFSIRLPYAKSARDFKRLSALAITSNTDAIINDQTGNTRILPFPVKQFLFDKNNKINRDALFMELSDLYDAGEPYYLTKDEEVFLTNMNDSFSHTIIEDELIDEYTCYADKGGMSVTMVMAALKDVSGLQISKVKIREGLTKKYGRVKSVKTENGARKGFPVKLNDQYHKVMFEKKGSRAMWS